MPSARTDAALQLGDSQKHRWGGSCVVVGSKKRDPITLGPYHVPLFLELPVPSGSRCNDRQPLPLRRYTWSLPSEYGWAQLQKCITARSS